ncbi:MAG: T9SS type A sorting domain-containing protein [Bacteroidia bacterium]|nr:T9SS type A sorting domain-containing protein [Bacteroidia bacterium]
MTRRSKYSKVLLITLLLASFPGVLKAQRVGCLKYAYMFGYPTMEMPKYRLGMALVSMDINKDGHLDLLASANGPNTVFCYYGGPVLFDTTADLSLRGSAEMVKGDFNGDGLIDLAVRSGFFRDVQRDVTRFDTFLVYMGVEDSLYAIETQPRFIIPGPLSSMGGQPERSLLGSDLFAADLDCDGRDELIMASSLWYDTLRAQATGAIFVWHYPRGDDTDTISYIYLSDHWWSSYNSIGVGDINGDGCADIQLAVKEKLGLNQSLPPKIRVAFGQPGKYPDPSRANQIFENDVMGYSRDTYINRLGTFFTTLLDVNNDGMADMLWVPCTDSLLIMYGTPEGLSGKVDRIITNHDKSRWTGFGRKHFKIGDYNGDGLDDYVLNLSTEGGYSAMIVYGGNRSGLTDQPLAVCVVGVASSARFYVRLGDITGDGAEEHAVSEPEPAIGPAYPWWKEEGMVGVIRGAAYINTNIDAESEALDPRPAPFSLEVYPSPSSGDITLLLKDEAPGEYQLKMYALDGKVILTRNYQLVNSGNVIVLQAGDYASDYSPGVHFIELRSAAGSVTRKVVLMKK